MSQHNKKTKQTKNADRLINKYAFGSGLAGYIPIPFLGTLGVMLIQRKMLFKLSKNYNIAYSRSIAKDLLTTLAGGLAAKTAIPITIKMIPGIGVLLGGTGMAAIGSAATYAVGKVFQQHFEEGGNLEDFDATKKKEHFEAELKLGLKQLQEKH